MHSGNRQSQDRHSLVWEFKLLKAHGLKLVCLQRGKLKENSTKTSIGGGHSDSRSNPPLLGSLYGVQWLRVSSLLWRSMVLLPSLSTEGRVQFLVPHSQSSGRSLDWCLTAVIRNMVLQGLFGCRGLPDFPQMIPVPAAIHWLSALGTKLEPWLVLIAVSMNMILQGSFGCRRLPDFPQMILAAAALRWFSVLGMEL